MKEWKEYRLGDLITFQNGYAFKSSSFETNGKYKIIKIKELKNGKIKFTTETATIDSDINNLKKYIVKHNDIIFALTGDPVSKPNPLSWVGRVALYTHKKVALINQRTCKLVCNNELINPLFIYYYFSIFKNLYSLASRATGSANQANISTKTIEETNVLLPTKRIQDKIVDVLKYLDDKIQINNKINENLEQQAQALFKSWFVDFEPFKDGKFVDSELGMIPEGWEIGMLKDISNIVMGQSPKGKSLNELGEGIVFYQGRTEFGERFPSIRQYTTEPKKYAEPFSVLLSVRAPVGDINITPYKCCIGRGIASLMAKNNNKSFLYYYLKYLNRVFDRYNGEGTVFGCINKKALEEIKIIIPKASIIKDYEQITEAMDNIILNNFLENERLSSIRDTLLPKLMSGEIELK